MKVKASHGDVYDIPEEFEKLFWSFDEVFVNSGISGIACDLLPAWDAAFDAYLLDHEQ